MSQTEDTNAFVHVPAPVGSYTPNSMHSLYSGSEPAGQAFPPVWFTRKLA